MKRLFTQIMLVICCIMVCGITSNATCINIPELPEGKDAIKAPFATISDIYINKPTVTKNDTLKYRFTVSFVPTYNYCSEEFECGSFLDDYVSKDSYYYVVVHWQSSKKQEVVRIHKWTETEKSVTVEGEIPVQKGMQAGEWKISEIHIDNYLSTEGDSEGDSLEIRNGTEEQQLKEGDFNTYYTDLSAFNFNVTGVDKKADNNAPTINLKSLKLSKRYVEKNQKSTFSVKIKDASTIEKVKCQWGKNDKAHDKKYYNWSDEYTMKYDKKTKRYQCVINIDTKLYRKTALRGIYVKDIYGNEKYYFVDLDNYAPSKKTRKYYDAYKKMIVIAK